jgi:membrane-associated protease RseP (regulator of RpoE activity)
MTSPYSDQPSDRASSQGEPSSLLQALEADPLGLAAHRDWDGGDAPAPSPDRARWALVRLGIIIAAVLVGSFLLGVGETVLLVFALILCIVLHEFGHFIMAKLSKIKVTQFFVGFGPTLWSVQRGETEYGVKALPFGGFCRIIGMHNLEEVDPADEPRTYRQKSMWRRLSVALAGSAMHFLIALVVLFSMFFWAGDSSGYLAPPPSSPIIGLDRLASGASPAIKAGFRIGDRIMSIDGIRFKTDEAQTDFIRSHPDKRLTIVVKRGDRLVTLYPTPVNLQDTKVSGIPADELPAATKPTGFIGIETSAIVHSSFTASISAAGGDFVHDASLTLDALGRLVTFHGISDYFHMLGSQKDANSSRYDNVRFVSPVGVVSMFHTAASDGIGTELYLLGIINISLGLFNLIPLLPLDGGHVAIALYEGVRSRRKRRYHADVGKLLPLFYLAIVLIAFLGVSSLFLDIRGLVA